MKFTKLIIAMFIAMTALTGCEKKSDAIVYGNQCGLPSLRVHRRGSGGDEVVGFDVEIAREIAKDLGKELEIEDMEFDTLLTALNADKIDFVIAGMTIEPQKGGKRQLFKALLRSDPGRHRPERTERHQGH